MHYLIGLFLVVALFFGGLMLISQVQENHNETIRLNTMQEHTRALDRAHLETTRAQNNALATQAFNSQVQTFTIAVGVLSNMALSWAVVLLVAGSLVGLVLVLLSRQRLGVECDPRQLPSPQIIVLNPGPTPNRLSELVESGVVRIPATIDRNVPIY